MQFCKQHWQNSQQIFQINWQIGLICWNEFESISVFENEEFGTWCIRKWHARLWQIQFFWLNKHANNFEIYSTLILATVLFSSSAKPKFSELTKCAPKMKCFAHVELYHSYSTKIKCILCCSRIITMKNHGVQAMHASMYLYTYRPV